MSRFTLPLSSAALAFSAVLAASPAFTTPAMAHDSPPMRLVAVPSDFSDPANVQTFVDRTVAESRAWCAVHGARVTPDRPDDPSLCERVMADRAVQALPTGAWRSFVSAGGVRALHRRQR